jgi:hypothetical protein
MDSLEKQKDSERIRLMIEEQNLRYASRGGSVALAGIEGSTIKITPAGFCWR